jgi:hypothetical protein
MNDAAPPLGVPEKIVALHAALVDVPHAFGGALALAWCTERARGTIDIDLNLFVTPHDAVATFAALPSEVTWSQPDIESIERDGQVRVWWGSTPLDLFFNTTEFHEQVAERARFEPFMGALVPFLSCRDLAVFKAFFDRTKDWADLEEMATAGCLDVAAVAGVLAVHLGGDDHRIERLRALA